MECIGCSNKEVTFFFDEHLDCFYCNGHNDVSYYICRECGLIFRIINETINEVVAHAEIEQINAFYNNLSTQREQCVTMQQMVHRCIKCNAFAYEVMPGCYKCSKCSFSWEKI